MAFNEQEKQIILYGRQNGKSQAEVQDALYRFRTGRPVTSEAAPAEAGGGALDTIKSAALGGVQKVKEGVRQLVTPPSTDAVDDSAFNIPLGALKTLQGALHTVFSPLAPLLKPLADLQSRFVDKLSDTKPLREFGEGTADLPANDQTGAELALEGASAMSDLAGAAAGGKAIPATVRTASTLAADATKALSGITETGAQGIKTAASRGIAADGIMQRVARIPKGKQAAFQQASGTSVGKYLVDRGIFGNIDQISEQLYGRFNQSRTSVDDALAKLPGAYKTTAIGNALKQLSEREQRVSSPGAISKDLERVRELSKKHSGGGLTMSEVNEVKRLFERNVRLDYVKENVPDKVEQANNLDSAIRTWQQSKASELGFKNIKQLNRETMLAKQLLDDIGVEYTGSAGNNAITLTDWIILAGGDPTAVSGFLAKRLLSSRSVMSKIAEMVAPEAKEGLPKAEFGEPTINGYANFLRAIEDRAKQPTKQ